MPVSKFGGKMSDEELVLVEAFLRERWTNRKCPACGTEDWHPGKHFLKDEEATTVHVLSGEGTVYVPYVVYFCKNCALAMRFNAGIIWGLLGRAGELYEQDNMVREEPHTDG